MFETLQEKTEEKAMVQFLERFTDYPFLVKFKNSEYHIGEGEPTFTVNFKKAIPLADLMKSTSLALGEAYMRGDLDIEGNLYEALDHFLGQMGKFSTNESALKKIMFSSTSKKNQEKEVTSHYDIGNDFYKLGLDETMSYSCGYFIHEDDTLYQAQVNKVDYILKKLHLEEGMSLLDIGCGWGFLPVLLLLLSHLPDPDDNVHEPSSRSHRGSPDALSGIIWHSHVPVRSYPLHMHTRLRFCLRWSILQPDLGYLPLWKYRFRT